MISPGSELKSACKLYRQTLLTEYIKIDKGKPVERQGRKAMGLNPVRSIPDEIVVQRGTGSPGRRRNTPFGFLFMRPGH